MVEGYIVFSRHFAYYFTDYNSTTSSVFRRHNMCESRYEKQDTAQYTT